MVDVALHPARRRPREALKTGDDASATVMPTPGPGGRQRDDPNDEDAGRGAASRLAALCAVSGSKSREPLAGTRYMSWCVRWAGSAFRLTKISRAVTAAAVGARSSRR